MRAKILLLLLLALIVEAAQAHVGSKDVYQDVTAGPYKLFVTIRMPNVIPGVAAIEVRSTGAAPSAIEITPLPLVGEASKHPPAADAMQVSSADPSFYTGSLWMMGFGSWQVRFHVTGAAGDATAGVPVPATAILTLPMSRGLGITLVLLGLFLVITMAGIVAAAVSEARVRPGELPPPSRRRRALVAALSTQGVLGRLNLVGCRGGQLSRGYLPSARGACLPQPERSRSRCRHGNGKGPVAKSAQAHPAPGSWQIHASLRHS
jgi:hypothetical protein